MIMKRQILNFLLLSIFAVSVSAQINEARKVDEFGIISCDDLMARVDNFFLELKNFPNSGGYILVYEGNLSSYLYGEGKTFRPRRGEAKNQVEAIKDRIKFSRLDDKKVMFIEGGFRKNLTVEFWFVPNNATPPKPTPTLKTMKYRKGKPTDPCKDM